VFKLRTHNQISYVVDTAANVNSFPHDKPDKLSTLSAHKMYGIKSLFLAGRRTGSLLPVHRHRYWVYCLKHRISWHRFVCATKFNTLRTGDVDLRFYNTTVQDGLCKSAFLTRACFLCTVHLIMQYIEPVSEWFC